MRAWVIIVGFIALQLTDRPVCIIYQACDRYSYTAIAHMQLSDTTDLWGLRVRADSIVYGNIALGAGHMQPVLFVGGAGVSKHWAPWTVEIYGVSEHFIQDDPPRDGFDFMMARAHNYLEVRREF